MNIPHVHLKKTTNLVAVSRLDRQCYSYANAYPNTTNLIAKSRLDRQCYSYAECYPNSCKYCCCCYSNYNDH